MAKKLKKLSLKKKAKKRNKRSQANKQNISYNTPSQLPSSSNKLEPIEDKRKRRRRKRKQRVENIKRKRLSLNEDYIPHGRFKNLVEKESKPRKTRSDKGYAREYIPRLSDYKLEQAIDNLIDRLDTSEDNLLLNGIQTDDTIEDSFDAVQDVIGDEQGEYIPMFSIIGTLIEEIDSLLAELNDTFVSNKDGRRSMLTGLKSSLLAHEHDEEYIQHLLDNQEELLRDFYVVAFASKGEDVEESYTNANTIITGSMTYYAGD